MPDEPAVELSTTGDFVALLARWRAAFHGIREQMPACSELMEDALLEADSEDTHERALGELKDVRRDARQSLVAIEGLLARAEALRAEWRAARRYEPDALHRRVADLAAKVSNPTASGAHEWLFEIFDALDAWEWSAIETLSRADLPWPAELIDGAEEIRTGLTAWRAGDNAAGAELMEKLGEGTLEGWAEELDPQARSRAHRLAAWLWLRRLQDDEPAERHLSEAIKLFPYAGRMHAERAAYYLSIGELDQAVTDAQRAVELAADDAAGYLELGIWAELSGDYDDADALYRKALGLMPTFEVARIHTRASIMDPPGRLLLLAGETLFEKGRVRDALEATDRAMRADLRGSELHPLAPVHRLRSLALERTSEASIAEAAAEAAEAGKLYLWNGNPSTAIEQLERARSLNPEREDVGWLLADAQVATSMPLGTVVPDRAAVDNALDTWERWAAKVGPPAGDTSWAYLTRAIIADLITQIPGEDRLDGVWQALFYVEKALVHDGVDAQRWGYAAQYLRYVHLDELAFECADRGYRLSAADRQVLTERLTRLVNDGDLAAAGEVAEKLVRMFGNDPWVSAARAWLAIHSDRPTRYAEALRLLEMPLLEGSDPSWYYELRSFCHVALGDPEAAREDLRKLLANAVPVDGTTKCRIAMAATAIGDNQEATRSLEEAQRDPTSRAITCLSAEALLAFSRGDVNAATSLLADATRHATSRVELMDIVAMMRMRLPLLEGGEDTAAERARALHGLEAGPVNDRAQELERHPPSAEGQLEEALARFDERSTAVSKRIATTLLAVRARRKLDAGRLEEAITAYEALLGSSFEPEATLGLANALKRQSIACATAGDADAVRRIQDQLSTLGDVSPAESTIALAFALEQAGRYLEAREALDAGIEAARSDSDREELHQRAGGLALAQNDVERAALHFRTALASAKEREDQVRVGQLEIRLALLGLLAEDLSGAVVHLLAATRAWRDSGALDPAAALVEELRGLAERPRQGSWRTAARRALEYVEAATAPPGKRSELGSDIEVLQREFNVTASG